MIREHYWHDMPAAAILNHVFACSSRVAQHPDRPELIDLGLGAMHPGFEKHAIEQLGTDQLRYWGSSFNEDETVSGSSLRAWPDSVSARAAIEAPGEWIPGFPHIHGWTPGARCMITCLQAPDAGGKLVLFNEIGVEFSFRPTPGMSVTFPMGSDDALAHGVRPIQGQRYRIMLVAVSLT
jgi:hypothetical protein